MPLSILLKGSASGAGPGAVADPAADPAAHPLTGAHLAGGRQPRTLARSRIPRVDPGASGGEHGAHGQARPEAAEVEEEQPAAAATVVVAQVLVDDLAVLVGAVG